MFHGSGVGRKKNEATDPFYLGTGQPYIGLAIRLTGGAGWSTPAGRCRLQRGFFVTLHVRGTVRYASHSRIFIAT